ncbi:IS1 family transposase, partial [Escherichia coli]|uniref:IS1 family transposase n=1 Tax=Escherichia coli TaxID=562 RepID=UPI003904BC83
TSLKKLRPQSVTSRIQPGSDVIVCAEMDEQWGYVGAKEGANKRGNSSRLTQSFHFFMFEPIFSPVNALNQP